MLLITGISNGLISADTAVVSHLDEQVDAVSSATGTVITGIKLYKKYGILTVEFPHNMGKQWKMETDDDSTGTVKVIRAGDTGKVWYAGIEADSESGWIKLVFTLHKGNNECAERYVYLLVAGNKITAVANSFNPDWSE